MEDSGQPGPSETCKACIICKKSDVGSLKLYKTHNTVRNAAERRRSLKSDKYEAVTKDILSSESSSSLYYHTQCHSRYCAIGKRKVQEVEEETPNITRSSKSLRSKSDLPQSSRRGVLKPSCIFCLKIQKRVKSGKRSYEYLHKIETLDCSNVIFNAAKQNKQLEKSQRILAFGSEDLIAAKLHYHNTCKLKFLREANEISKESTSSFRKQHEKAFEVFMSYINSELIAKQLPKYVSKLMYMYKQHYKEMWGTDDQDIDGYIAQNFTRKLQSKFGEQLQISKSSNKEGNFVYPQGMSKEEARLSLRNTDSQEDQVRCAALILRSEIMHMQATKMPTPTSIQSLKENAPDIPPLTKLFYETLLSGLSSKVTETSERKTLSMASDAVFGASRGTIKPWKQTALGLGVSSMLGSKTAVTILNRLGHTWNLSCSYKTC